MGKREFIDKKAFIDRSAIEFVSLKDSLHYMEWNKNNEVQLEMIATTITEQEIAKPLFTEFKEKLSKWMYHNSESVCGDRMIDIDYLEGHIDEILYEMGIIGEVEDGSN